MKVARKLSFWTFVGFLLILSAHAYRRIQREIDYFESDARADHRLLGTTLAIATKQAITFQGTGAATALVERTDIEKAYVKIRWVAVQRGEIGGPPERPELASGVVREPVVQAVVPASQTKEGDDRLFTYLPLRVGPASYGAIELNESLAARSGYVRRTILNAALLAAAMAIVSGFVSMGLGAWFVGRPVHRLIAKAREVGEGHFDPPLPPGPSDELGELSEAFNEMCAQLSRARTRLSEEAAARVAAVEALRHADRLTTIGSLASAIAHEVGTPLNVVLGHAKLIRKAASSDAAIAEGASVIMDQCQRMSGIVRQVLDYAQRRSPTKVRSDLRDLISQCVSLLRPLAQQRNVALETDFGDSQFAHVDAVQLQQAITNIVLNAVQASVAGERVSVRLRMDPASTEAEPKAVISIEDFGAGISAATLEHIFEPFFSTKPSSEGTGLGLSIAKGIIEEHGGSIRVLSVVGTGSRFEIDLPVEA